MKIEELGADAVLDALDDASMDVRDVEAMYSGSLYEFHIMGERIQKYIGMTEVPVTNVVNACATGSTASSVQ